MNVISKACRAFRTCKGTFAKTGVLKTGVVRCIYTLVILAMLTYGFMVWWLRVRYNISRMELSQLQKLTCLWL
jgi:hypothetical protein